MSKYAFIDALRGIAFLGVFMCHAGGLLPKLGCPVSLSRIALQGGIGVQLFFIASALTLMLSLDARTTVEAHPLRNFYLRRFFRIAPLFYVGILFYGLVIGGNHDPRSPMPLSVGSYVSTALFVGGWNRNWINQVVPGGWSIFVEMTFYLMVPYFHATLKNVRHSLMAAVVMFVLGYALSEWVLAWLDRRWPSQVPGLNEAFVHYWLPYQLYRFFAGFTLYFLIRERLKAPQTPDATRSRVLESLGLLALSVTLLAAASLGRVPRAVSTPSCTIALVLLCWSLATYPLPFLVNTATRWIGRLSFSCYISHFVVIDIVWALFQRAGLIANSSSWLILVPAFLLTALALTMAISELTFRWIEQPGIQLGRQVTTRLNNHALAKSERLPEGA